MRGTEERNTGVQGRRELPYFSKKDTILVGEGGSGRWEMGVVGAGYYLRQALIIIQIMYVNTCYSTRSLDQII